jgi:hypothetical protein
MRGRRCPLCTASCSWSWHASIVRVPAGVTGSRSRAPPLETVTEGDVAPATPGKVPPVVEGTAGTRSVKCVQRTSLSAPCLLCVAPLNVTVCALSSEVSDGRGAGAPGTCSLCRQCLAEVEALCPDPCGCQRQYGPALHHPGCGWAPSGRPPLRQGPRWAGV